MTDLDEFISCKSVKFKYLYSVKLDGLEMERFVGQTEI